MPPAAACACRLLLVLYALLTGALTGWTLLVSQDRASGSPECTPVAFVTVAPPGRMCEYKCVGRARL